MSLVDPKHIEPARRGRHGVHYFSKANETRLIPCATFYPTMMEKKICVCGKENYPMTEREKRVFGITEDEANACVSCGASLINTKSEILDTATPKDCFSLSTKAR